MKTGLMITAVAAAASMLTAITVVALRPNKVQRYVRSRSQWPYRVTR